MSGVEITTRVAARRGCQHRLQRRRRPRLSNCRPSGQRSRRTRPPPNELSSSGSPQAVRPAPRDGGRGRRRHPALVRMAGREGRDRLRPAGRRTSTTLAADGWTLIDPAIRGPRRRGRRSDRRKLTCRRSPIAASKQPKHGNDVKAKIQTFLEKLGESDATPGLHIEPINGSVDPRVRTGRVDQYLAGRAVPVDPPRARPTTSTPAPGRTTRATEKAKKLTLHVNPVNGVLELREAIAAQRTRCRRSRRRGPPPVAASRRSRC